MPRRDASGTSATVVLTAAGVTFTRRAYEHDPSARSFGLEAALVLGLPAEQVFKTLLVETGPGRPSPWCRSPASSTSRRWLRHSA